MSFVFRGTRGDLEDGLGEFIPERRALRAHNVGRPAGANSMVFLFTVLLLFMILNSHQMSPNFLIWMVLAVFFMATAFRMYAACQQLHAQAQTRALAAAAGLLGHSELRLQMPPSVAIAARGRLQGFRLQLALLDRELDDLDYDALRSLDAEDSLSIPSMTEEEINALPIHQYKAQPKQPRPVLTNGLGPAATPKQTSSSTSDLATEKGRVNAVSEANSRSSDDELLCSVCLEQVNAGDLIRTLPCLHQFHVSCIDPWLRQQGTCPICKHRAGHAWVPGADVELDGAYVD
ncbi:RING/U-box superfamily protein [Wolffia australiana]